MQVAISGFMNMCIYKLVIVFSSYRFLGRQRSGSVKVQAKQIWHFHPVYVSPFSHATMPGKHKGVGLLYHLLSLPVAKKGKFQAPLLILFINQPMGMWDIY